MLASKCCFTLTFASRLVPCFPSALRILYLFPLFSPVPSLFSPFSSNEPLIFFRFPLSLFLPVLVAFFSPKNPSTSCISGGCSTHAASSCLILRTSSVCKLFCFLPSFLPDPFLLSLSSPALPLFFGYSFCFLRYALLSHPSSLLPRTPHCSPPRYLPCDIPCCSLLPALAYDRDRRFVT